MIAGRAGSEARRHRTLLSSTSEVRITKIEGTDLYEVMDTQAPEMVLEMDRGEVDRLRQRADGHEVAITSRMLHGGAYQEATRLRGRLDGRQTLRPSLHRFIFVAGQQRAISVGYHIEGRRVPPAVISGDVRAYVQFGVLGSTALKLHDTETGVGALILDESALFCRATYSGADEVHIDLLPGNNAFRRAGQPYRVSVGVTGGAKVFVSFATEAEVASLRSHLDQTFLIIRQEGQVATQRGWPISDEPAARFAA